jgi:hypothetical protein
MILLSVTNIFKLVFTPKLRLFKNTYVISNNNPSKYVTSVVEIIASGWYLCSVLKMEKERTKY